MLLWQVAASVVMSGLKEESASKEAEAAEVIDGEGE
jgi:hypothetical protein